MADKNPFSFKLLRFAAVAGLILPLAAGASAQDLFLFADGWFVPVESERENLNLDDGDQMINVSDLLLFVEGTPVSNPVPTNTSAPTVTPTPTVSPTSEPTQTPAATSTPVLPLTVLANDHETEAEGSRPSLAGAEGDRYWLVVEDGDDGRLFELEVEDNRITDRQEERWEDVNDPYVAVGYDNDIYVAMEYDDGSGGTFFSWREPDGDRIADGRISVGLDVDAPAVAVDSAGWSISVWENKGALFGDRIDGTVVDDMGGIPFDDFTLSDEDPSQPDVAVDQEDVFLVVWSADDEDDVMGTFLWITTGGSLLGSNDFRISSEDDKDRRDPRVFPLDDENNAEGFVVVWWDTRVDPEGDIYARTVRLDDGERDYVSEEFRVDNGDGGARYPSAAYLSGNTILFAWSDSRNGEYNVYGALYNRMGERLSEDFRMDDPKTDLGEVRFLDLAPERKRNREFDDEVMLVWDEEGTIFAKLFRLE